jgi:hypothetical protein
MSEPGQDVGFVSVDAWSEESFVVPIEHFNFDAIDQPEEFIREIILSGEKVMPYVEATVQARLRTEKGQAVIRVLQEIVDSNTEAGKTAWAIAAASGMALGMGLNMKQIAEDILHTEKQGFHQLVQTMADRLHLPMPPSVRTELACVNMKESYSKRAKNPIKAICKTKQ